MKQVMFLNPSFPSGKRIGKNEKYWKDPTLEDTKIAGSQIFTLIPSLVLLGFHIVTLKSIDLTLLFPMIDSESQKILRTLENNMESCSIG